MKIADTSFYVFQALNSLIFLESANLLTTSACEAQLKLEDSRKQLQQGLWYSRTPTVITTKQNKPSQAKKCEENSLSNITFSINNMIILTNQNIQVLTQNKAKNFQKLCLIHVFWWLDHSTCISMIIVMTFHVVLFLEKDTKGLVFFFIKICSYSHIIKNQQIVFSYNKKTSNQYL